MSTPGPTGWPSVQSAPTHTKKPPTPSTHNQKRVDSLVAWQCDWTSGFMIIQS